MSSEVNLTEQNDVIGAVLIDETKRLLGDHWVSNFTQRNVDVQVSEEHDVRTEIRNFIANEIESFIDRPYNNHPDYKTQFSNGIIEEELTDINVTELAEKMSNANAVHQNKNTVAIWVDGEQNDAEILIYNVTGNRAFFISNETVNKRNVKEKMAEFAEYPSKSFDTQPRWDQISNDDSTVTPDPRNNELTAEDREKISKIIYDEIQRVSGNEWVERIKERSKGYGMSPTSVYTSELTYHDDTDHFYPPTESNIRKYARKDVANSIRMFDDHHYSPSEDYEGTYDPNDLMKSNEEKLLTIISNAEEVVKFGNSIGVANGINFYDTVSYNSKNSEFDMSKGEVVVTFYSPQYAGETPTQVRSTSVDVSNREELREKMEEMTKSQDERWNKDT